MAYYGSSHPATPSPNLGSQITVYCRIKPINGPLPFAAFNISLDAERDENGNKAEFLHIVPKQIIYPQSNQSNPFKNPSNKPEIYSFGFAKVLDASYNQESVFNISATPIIESVLDGFNGTIFAYGQTGTGKSFTMTGNFSDPEYRGIIPRSIQYIFQKIEHNTYGSIIHNISASYLEIYNEVVYDLLTNTSRARKLEDFHKVTVVNNELKNLSKHSLTSENEANALLELGNSNRATAETVQNLASSRSHCIFTLYISGIRNPCGNDARPFSSKLHLVDLAGSERIAKHAGTDQVLYESKSINLSLSHLEHVITALNEPGRSHIPYRNSMLTTVLKDSLGGNSLTTFLAMISLEQKYIQETISTCRFMQRVGKVKNFVSRNEQLIHFQPNFQESADEVFEPVNQRKVYSSTSTSPLKLKPLSPIETESQEGICGTLRPPLLDLDDMDAEENRARLVAQLVDHLIATNETQPILQSSCNFYDLNVLSDCYTVLRSEVVESRTEIARLQNQVRNLNGTVDGLNTLLRQYENCDQCLHCVHGVKMEVLPVPSNEKNKNISSKSKPELPIVAKSNELSPKPAIHRNPISMGIFTPPPSLSFREMLQEIGPNVFVKIYDKIMSVLFPGVPDQEETE